MIFYFTGTGNSWYAASKIRGKDEQMISIAECVKHNRYEFDFEGEKQVGFVFPVYFYGIPTVVAEFIRRLQTKNRPGYTYALLTCGGSMANASGMLTKLLRRKSWRLDAVYSVKMPDNYILMFQAPEDEKTAQLIEAADERLRQYRKLISLREICRTSGNLPERILTGLVYPLYVRGRKTAPFHADDSCVGCGICAGRCPAGAIEMKGNEPVWVKEKCTMCMACCRCNAIQYGNRLQSRRRYVNPEYKERSGSGL